MLPKLFGPLRERYLNRPGGYTRVLRIEPEKEDQAPSAILELVDGPKDIRFAMTAKTIANVREKGNAINDMTAANIQKVIRFRPNGERDLEDMVTKFETTPSARTMYCTATVFDEPERAIGHVRTYLNSPTTAQNFSCVHVPQSYEKHR